MLLRGGQCGLVLEDDDMLALCCVEQSGSVILGDDETALRCVDR